MNDKIVVAISTKDRYKVFKDTLEKWKEYTPEDIDIIIVDDASAIPVKEATFRFERNVGIARTKNKCLELAEDLGAEHIFLVDDDVYPKQNEWWLPYTESTINHMCFIFPSVAGGGSTAEKISEIDGHTVWTHARGCVLYIKKKVLEVVGGMNPNYDKWGYEHKDWSNRIYNAGLTPFPYIDVSGSQKIFYSMDQAGDVASTTSQRNQQLFLSRGAKMYRESLTSSEYMEYRSEV